MSIKQKLNIFEKMYDIIVILVDFWGNIPRFWLFFCYPDPFHETDLDPAGQNETDPNCLIYLIFLR